MAHYAFIDNDNFVVEVITGRNENEVVDGISDWESYYSTKRNGQRCIRTSYNENIRKNFAGIGFKYSEELDAFIPPKPFSSWVLNEDTCKWEPPIEHPSDGGIYAWNENILNWELVTEV